MTTSCHTPLTSLTKRSRVKHEHRRRRAARRTARPAPPRGRAGRPGRPSPGPGTATSPGRPPASRCCRRTAENSSRSPGPSAPRTHRPRRKLPDRRTPSHPGIVRRLRRLGRQRRLSGLAQRVRLGALARLAAPRRRGHARARACGPRPGTRCARSSGGRGAPRGPSACQSRTSDSQARGSVKPPRSRSASTSSESCGVVAT